MPEEVIEGGEAVATDGAVETEGIDQAESGNTPEPQAWGEWESYKDNHIPIKVDGQEQLVPLGELRDGYMRQADHTQKTQALAEQRKALDWWGNVAQAAQLDPQRTIEFLQEQFGLTEAQAEEVADDQFLTDDQRELQDLQQWRQQQELEQVQKNIMAEEASLKALHGDDYDSDAVIQHAIEGNFENLTDAFHSLMGPKWFQEAKALRDFRAQREAELQKLAQGNQAAAQAAGVVNPGHGAQAGAVQSGSGAAANSIREAWASAVQQHS